MESTLTNEMVKELWRQVFPNSLMIISKACLGDSFFYHGHLASGRSESNHGILDNDPLNYMFNIDEGYYKESMNSVYIKPDNKYNCYSRDSIRKKSIKNITADKLLARFQQIKDLCVRNRENFINLSFNINDKI